MPHLKLRNSTPIIGITQKKKLFKFSQNENLKKQLLDTNDDILADASPYDKIYGIGMYPENKNV